MLSRSNTSTVTISGEHGERRLDNFLFSYLKSIPNSRIYRAIRSGDVRVNKRRAKPLQKLHLGDVIRIPPPLVSDNNSGVKDLTHVGFKIEETIIYEDDWLLVINKPKGMAVHGGSGLNYGVIELLRSTRAEYAYLELAHRIDRPTSGCLLIAKKKRLACTTPTLRSTTSKKDLFSNCSRRLARWTHKSLTASKSS